MNQIRAAILISLTAELLLGGGGRRKLWDLDLSKFANHQTDKTTLVWGIRFSPDETKVAIGFGSRWNFDPRPRHVIVVAVDQPHAPRPRQAGGNGCALGEGAAKLRVGLRAR